MSFFCGSVCVGFGCFLLIGAMIVGIVTLSLLFYQLSAINQFLEVQQQNHQILSFQLTEIPKNFNFQSTLNYTVQNNFEKEIYIRHGFIDVYYKNFLISNTKTTKEYILLKGFEKVNFTFNIQISKDNLLDSIMKPMLDDLKTNGKVEFTFYGRIAIFFVYTGSKLIDPFTFNTPLIN